MKISTEDHGSWIDSRGRRRTEWTAYDEETYDGPSSPVGYGSTEQGAIDDLMDRLSETL
jgi:hypothetical protein